MEEELEQIASLELELEVKETMGWTRVAQERTVKMMMMMMHFLTMLMTMTMRSPILLKLLQRLG